MAIKYGCQTYPWKMNYEKFAGNVPHMLKVVKQAGFQGFEAEIDMLGSYFENPEEFKYLLDLNELQFTTLVHHLPWKNSVQNVDEYQISLKAVNFVSQFYGAKLVVSHHAGNEIRPSGKELVERRRNLLNCIQQVADMAQEKGIMVCMHPNSAQNSLFKTKEDYDVFFEMINGTNIQWAPDIGHIVNGEIDPISLLEKGKNKIKHVHYKDYLEKNKWAVMGEGNIDYVAITNYLKSINYDGWIIVEDESDEAKWNSDSAVLLDGQYCHKFSYRY